jgi:hypothetical protein
MLRSRLSTTIARFADYDTVSGIEKARVKSNY